MRKYGAAAAVFLALGISAHAADMPVKAPYYKAAPEFNWTGFYVGAHAGYGWAKANFDSPIPPLDDSIRPHGFFGGLQAGYNWQFNPNWVVGLEADVSGASLNDNKFGPGALGLNFSDKINSFGTVRARLGYTSGMDMLYVTGGWAWIRNKAIVSVPGTATSLSDTHNGFAVGGGWEHAITANWTLKAEYLYLDAGHETYTFTPFFGLPYRADLTMHTVRLGVNYKF